MTKSGLFSITVFTIMIFSFILSCKSNEHNGAKSFTTILVQLHDATAIAALESDYDEFSLKKEKTASRPMNIYVFSFNSDKITDTELIRLLKRSSLVKEAQTNKQINTREN